MSINKMTFEFLQVTRKHFTKQLTAVPTETVEEIPSAMLCVTLNIYETENIFDVTRLYKIYIFESPRSRNIMTLQ